MELSRPHVKLDDLGKTEITWWHKHINNLKKYLIDTARSATPVLFEVVSDASGIGHFCYIVNDDRTMLTARAFT